MLISLFKPEPVEASGTQFCGFFLFLCCELTEESEHHPLLVRRGKRMGSEGEGLIWSTYCVPALC